MAALCKKRKRGKYEKNVENLTCVPLLPPVLYTLKGKVMWGNTVVLHNMPAASPVDRELWLFSPKQGFES